MKKIVILFLFLITSVTFGQDTIRPSKTKDTIRILKPNIQPPAKDIDVGRIKDTQRVFRKKDSLFVIKKDSLFEYSSAAKIDSLWMQSMIKSPLYDTIAYVIKDDEIYVSENKDLSTQVLKNRLQILNEKTPFHIEYNVHLERLIKSYLQRRKAHFSTLMERARYFFPLFEELLAKYDIPMEMKYLAIVESALRPTAESHMGAKGLWQFMYQTGKQFGLNVSSYVDERSDPYRATEAACQYLSQLYNIFQDWDLALAAYNSGPGNVTKAIRRSGGHTNYWNIRAYLPYETAGYVPAFYATLYIFEYAKEHQIKGKNNSIPYFKTDTVQLKRQLTFAQIHNILGVDIEILQFLNPQYKLDIVPYIKNKNYTLTLPYKHIGTFLSNEQRIYDYASAEDSKREKPLPKYVERGARIRYRVRQGDYLGKIARRYGVSVSRIKKWNRLRSNRIRVGQRLTIYPRR